MVIKHLPDSASREDSLAWMLNTLARYNQHKEMAQVFENLSQLDSGSVPRLDSLELEPQARQLVEKYIPERFGSFSEGSDFASMKDAHLANVPLDPADPSGALPVDPNISPKDQVATLQENLSGKQLAKMHEKLTKLKAKYVSVPDLSRPTEGIKRNSLKGRPLKDRIYFGGNVALQSTDPIITDVDVQVGYKFNRDFVAGAGFKWRETFNNEDKTSALTEDAHGYSFFCSYDIIKGFFAYAEYAAVIDQPIFNESSTAGNWQYEYLLGVGRKFRLLKFVDLTVMFLYDFNHQHNNLHPRPFVMKVGYRITGFPFK